MKEDHLFRIKPDKPADLLDESHTEVSYFTIKGREDYLDSDGNPRMRKKESNTLNRAYAYTQTVNNKIDHFILTNDKGELFNPNGMFMSESLFKNKNMAGRKLWNFTRVTAEVFRSYLQFLNTRNVAYYNVAQREVLNG